MSIEPTCTFCGLVDKSRCKTPDQAEDCAHAPVEGKGPTIKTGPLAGLKRRHYKVIYADPPWTFTTRSDKGKDRSPEQHYDCMTLAEIKAMPVKELAAKDCVLLMWIIDTHVQMALDVMSAWGFTYKTKGFTWAKLNNQDPEKPQDVTDPSAFFCGMGFWTRANPEDCLLGTIGSPKRNEGGKGVRRLIVAERREHSRKPDELYGRIETLVPGPYVELFSRSSREGWDAMGNETGKFDGIDPVEEAMIEDLL
jgi:N6-adenosine-specific RNA methylase IME4